MTVPDSGVERQIPLSEAMDLLGVKKDAYGDRRKFLGIQHIKGEDGKAYLSPEDFKLMEALGEYIKENNTMEGFVNPNSGELVVSNAAGIKSVESSNPYPCGRATEEIPVDSDLEDLIRAAAELKGQRLVMPELVVQALADKMTYEDLPDDVKEKVDAVRNASSPKQPSQVAEQILAKYRSGKAA